MRRRVRQPKAKPAAKKKAAPRRKQPQSDSHLVLELLKQIREAGLPEPTRELKFHTNAHKLFPKKRLWRFDLAYSDYKLAIECDGGVFSRGRHVRPVGFVNDLVKLNAAILEGWTVLRFTINMIKDGTAIAVLEEALRQREEGVA